MIYLLLLYNLFLTVLIEGITIALLFRRREYVYNSILCNILTNPALNLVLLIVVHFCGTAFYWFVLSVLEIIALFIEAYVLRLLCRFSSVRSIAVSALMNILSCAAGLLLYGTGIFYGTGLLLQTIAY